MAAHDRFESFNSSLTKADRELIKDYIKTKRQEMLALRSEDARVRLVDEYVQEVHGMSFESKR